MRFFSRRPSAFKPATVLSRRQGLLAACALVWGGEVWAAGAMGVEVVPWPARQPMPKLEASDLSGKLWRLHDLQGRAVLLHFWSSADADCVAHLTALQTLAEWHGPDRLVVLTINVRDALSRIRQLVDDHNLSLPMLRDPLGEAAKRWNVRRLPGTVLVGMDGRPRQRVQGGLDWSGAQASRWVEDLFRKRPRHD